MASNTTTKPSFTMVNVTPKLAADWLSKNDNNRNVRSLVVDAYARDMALGNWQVTGEAVKFNTEGVLLDGQHRLLAILKSGKTVPMLIARGLATTTQDVMDTGAKRQAADMLKLNGVTHHTVIASAARLALTLSHNATSKGDTKNRSQSKSYTNSEIAAWVADNPQINPAAEAASHLVRGIDFSPSVLAVAWMELSAVDEQSCAEFFDALANNATKGKGDPRATLLRRVASARRNNEKLSQGTQMQFIVRAWNAWRQGESLHVLRSKNSSSVEGAVSVGIPKAV